MSGLMRGIGEYFLGLETHKDYVDLRRFYQEYETSPGMLKYLRDKSYFDEFLDIGVKRILPNLIDLGSITIAIVSKDHTPLWGVGIGELVRNYFPAQTKANRILQKEKIKSRRGFEELLRNDDASSERLP